MPEKSTFDAHSACLNSGPPCGNRFLPMFEQLISTVTSCFGYQGKQAEEFFQSVSVNRGTVLRESESMPVSRVLVELSVLRRALAVRVNYSGDGEDKDLSLQRIERVLSTATNEDLKWSGMVDILEFSQVDGMGCCALLLPLPSNVQEAGN